ncbi:MAG: MarR family transcriptional regulator [Leptospiraceae bacterium]|nr:MarR family transcriptional regulator [Leptospiraceae bacterium]
MGTKYKGTPAEMLALNAYITFIRAAETLTAHLGASLTQKGLTLSQFGILEALYFTGPQCQRELSTRMLKSRANITTVIDNLEKQALVKRIRQKEDRRFVTIHLTTKGRACIETRLPDHIQEIVTCLEALNKKEQTDLYRIARKLGLAVARQS